MNTPIRILYVDDSPLDRDLVLDSLEKEHGGFQVTQAASRADFEIALSKGSFDLILSDFNILGFEGLQVLETVHAKDPDLPVVIVTGTGSEEIAVEAMKRGAADYVIKTPKHIQRLPLTIHAALDKKHLKEDRDRLFNLSLDLLCVAGFDGTFKQLNPAWEKTLGWSKQELLSKPYLDFVHPDDRDATSQVAATLVDGRLVYHFENRYLCKDGSHKWISWNSYPLVDESLIFAVARDITERKQAEEALRQAEQKYRNIFENAMEGIHQTTREGRHISANPAAARMLGYGSPEELMSSINDLNLQFYVEPGRREEFARLMELHESVADFESEVYRKDGSRLWVSENIHTVRDEHGTLLYYEGTSEDITVRKQAEEKIQQQIERLTALREIDQTITSNFDLNHSLTTVISRAVTLLHVDAATVLLFQPETNTLGYGAGYGFRTTAPETASVNLGESYAGQAAMEKRLVQIPNLAEEPDNLFLTGFLKGEDFVSYYGTPLIVKGEVVGVLEVFNRSLIERDQDWLDFFITLAGQAAIAIANAQLFQKLRIELQERLRTEEEIRDLNLKLEQRVAERTIDLERALKVKDEFLANMSHELRTPLNAILGLTESMQEGTAGTVNEKQYKYLNTIQESGRHLLNLINDILDLAKIESGQVILDLVKVDIQSICQASLRMIQQLAHKKNLDVSFVMDNEIGLIWADQRRLKQMIVNLLSNAVKFTPDGGRLGLEVTANRQDHTVSIAVWDHGVGISESDLDRLFQPFVQVDSALSRNSSGTGLGLALVAQMAHLHGGQVRAKSTPGQGSRFTILLPWNPADRTGSLVPAKPAASSSTIATQEIPSHTILLVEDSAGAAMMVDDYLTTAGFNVMVAGNGLEAISLAETIQPDLILMDVMMPDMDGFEATRIIRKNPALQNTPILGLTALAMSGDRERSLEAGMNDHITKPVNLMDLLRAIRGYLPSDA